MKPLLLGTLCLSVSLISSASASLVGYWDFEANFDDQSGEGNNGTAVGNITLDNTSAAAGTQSMKILNADDSYLSINDGAGGMKISDFPAFTLSMWVNSAAIQDDKRIFSESSGTQNNSLYNLGTGAAGDGTNELDFYHRLADNSVTNNHGVTTATPFGDSTWHHVAVVDVSGEVDVYIDGGYDRSFSYADVSLEVDTTTFGGILRRSAATPICCGFNGSLDDIAVWDQELLPADIAAIAAKSVTPATLVPTPIDSDGDGLRDDFEQLIIDADPDDLITSLADVLPGDDFDMDTSINSAEAARKTDPVNPDTDGDGANDGSETNTGTWLSVTDRGTDPLDEDSDDDDLLDGVENPDLPYDPANASTQPGTDPNVIDSDGDGFADGSEVAAGTDPTDPDDPAPRPALYIDFNSTTQDNGPHPVGSPYQDYNAGHEVAADFTRQTFGAFGGSVGITPTWPDSTDNRVQQMIDRAAGNDNQWLGTQVDLLTDWLGTDTRTGNGGNGNYDGVTGTPTTLLLTLDGVPGGSYDWTSYHHDTENIHASFTTEISTDGGATFESVGSSQMTSSSTGGTPANAARVTGPDPQSLSSTVRHSFVTDGTSDIVLRFVPLSRTSVHLQFFAINGFDLVQTSSNFAKFAITDLSYNADTDELTVTWPSTPGQVFSIDTSADLVAWTGDLEDGLLAAPGAEQTSYTFPLADRLAGETRYFLRVRINPPIED